MKQYPTLFELMIKNVVKDYELRAKEYKVIREVLKNEQT